jgi:hypothetical protein
VSEWEEGREDARELGGARERGARGCRRWRGLRERDAEGGIHNWQTPGKGKK